MRENAGRSEASETAERSVRRSRGAGGCTLLEALVVLAVIAVVAGAAVPHAAGIASGIDLRSGALRLASALIRARAAALREGRSWVLEASERDFVLGPRGAPEQRESFPGRVRLRAATSGGDVRFAPDGTAENASFVLALEGQERRVVVNQRGRVNLD